MLLEAAIGDAFGAGYEYVKHKGIHGVDQLVYVQHPRHKGTRPGMYTDDTQMALAVAELLVSGRNWSAANVAEAFVTAFHRDPREGYAGGFHAFLTETTSADAFLANIRPNSDKSGAAMRAWPLGVIADTSKLTRCCQIQAAVTHNTESGINAAVASALMAHYFIYEIGGKARLPHWINAQVDGNWAAPYEDKVGSKGWMSVSAAITAVARNDTLSGLLMDCVNFGGDVDTVATIALAAAASSVEYTNDIPANLIDGLEDGKYGRTYIQDLDKQLMSLVEMPL